jgi:hypothetical protein
MRPTWNGWHLSRLMDEDLTDWLSCFMDRSVSLWRRGLFIGRDAP